MPRTSTKQKDAWWYVENGVVVQNFNKLIFLLNFVATNGSNIIECLV